MHGGCEPWDAEPSWTLAPLLPRRSHARILVVQAGLTALPQIRMLRRRTTHVGAGSLMTGRWFGNLKFLLILISPYCQDRSDALSLTCSASIETVLAPTWGEEPWWSRGDRRSHCEARKMRVPMHLLSWLMRRLIIDHSRAAGRDRSPLWRPRRVLRLRPDGVGRCAHVRRTTRTGH